MHFLAAKGGCHLSQLKNAGLIFETRHKNFIIYELNVSVFEEAMLWLA